MANKVWTVTEIIEKIQDEMDLQEESFINTAEYISYINEAIDEAEAEIMKIYEGYFNTTSTINLVAGTKAYAIPTAIYANKIKHVQYKKNSNDYYKVYRVKTSRIAWVEEQTSSDLSYDIQNDGTATGPEIVFYPTPDESITGGIRLWYVRGAERVSALSDLVDIPEFASFIFAYLKRKVALKEASPLTGAYEDELNQQRAQMVTTLSTMIPDEDTEIEMDMRFYNDFDAHIYYGEF
jgi:hypothetical protein